MRMKAVEPASKADIPSTGWNPSTNPAVRELLDHLADELAKEYIRLMKQTAAESSPATPDDQGQGG